MSRILCCLLLTAAIFGTPRKSHAQTVSPSTDNLTTVSWNRDTLQFGIIEEGAILLDSFLVTNTGTLPYQITHARASCDCTVLRYPKTPIKPGQTASIRIEFDSQGKAGLTQPGIIIYDNSTPNLRSILYLNGRVMPRKIPKK
ncbi:MAG TPA: DUF1573 domain-containing protein [Saprospiraceae bacterium]|nr:DUF1573 domain-containing protein [Saprospiraceae bacterium]